ncbi:hypothetical protein PO909_026346 [Leuciscus waleckii]
MRPSLLYCLLLYLCSSLFAGLVVSPCPNGCCCPHSGALVLCESLGLRTLPRSPYLGLQELSLSHNQLVRFPRGLPSSLETLQLQENQITYITAGSLRQLGNLTRLDLKDNRIRAIQPGALLGLTKLRTLTLKGNRLSRLPLNLPSSLTHLDQAFDGLSRLRSVELANNLWVCECDIMYLYRWLLMDRLRMASDLVCTAPLHLAHKLLLTLSVMAICPKLFKPVERMSSVNTTTESGKVVESHIDPTSSVLMLVRSDIACNTSSFRCQKSLQLPESTIPRSFFGSDQSTIERLSYEDCLLLNLTYFIPQHTQIPNSPATEKEPGCVENSTGQQSGASTTIGSMTTTRDIEFTPRTILQSSDPALIAVLAVLCVLTGLLMLTVLLVLKNILLRNLRVAPFPQVQEDSRTN